MEGFVLCTEIETFDKTRGTMLFTQSLEEALKEVLKWQKVQKVPAAEIAEGTVKIIGTDTLFGNVKFEGSELHFNPNEELMNQIMEMKEEDELQQ